MVVKPRGSWPPVPGLLVVLLDVRLSPSSSKPHNFSQPQLLTDAVSSPVAAVETGCM